jgi:transcription-repair coupling factor (superfamily II helicase)
VGGKGNRLISLPGIACATIRSSVGERASEPRSLRRGVFVSGQIERLSSLITGGSGIVSINGLSSASAKGCVFARLYEQAKRKLAIVVDSNADLDAWAANIEFFLSDADGRVPNIVSLPSFDTDVYSGVSPHAETQERRALALWQIANGNADIVILTARSLVQRTLSKKHLLDLGTKLVRDEDKAD